MSKLSKIGSVIAASKKQAYRLLYTSKILNSRPGCKYRPIVLIFGLFCPLSLLEHDLGLGLLYSINIHLFSEHQSIPYDNQGCKSLFEVGGAI